VRDFCLSVTKVTFSPNRSNAPKWICRLPTSPKSLKRLNLIEFRASRTEYYRVLVRYHLQTVNIVLSCRMNVVSHPAQAGSHRFFRHLVTSLSLCLDASPPTPRVLYAVGRKTSFCGSVFSSLFPLNPLESALPENAPVTRLESALPNLKDLKYPRIILLQKRWGQIVNWRPDEGRPPSPPGFRPQPRPPHRKRRTLW
jgi:hypothetical protein